MTSRDRGTVAPGTKVLSGQLSLTPASPAVASPPATGQDTKELGSSPFEIYIRPYRAKAAEITQTSSYQTARKARKGAGNKKEDVGKSPLCKSFEVIAWMLFALAFFTVFFLLFGLFGCGLEAPIHVVRFRNTTVATPSGGVKGTYLLESSSLFPDDGDINKEAVDDPSICEDWMPPVNFPMSIVFNYTSVENLRKTTTFSSLSFTTGGEGQLADGGAAIVVTITNPSRKRITTDYAWFNYNFWQAKFNYKQGKGDSIRMCRKGNEDSVRSANESLSNMPVWFLNLDEAARGRIPLAVDTTGQSSGQSYGSSRDEGHAQDPALLNSLGHSSTPALSGVSLFSAPHSLADRVREVTRDVLSSVSLYLADSGATTAKKKLCKYCVDDYGLEVSLNPWFCVSPFLVRDVRVGLITLKNVYFEGLLIPDFNLDVIKDNVTFLLHNASIDTLQLTKIPDHTTFLFETANLTRATSRRSIVNVRIDFPEGCDPTVPVGVSSSNACQLRFWGVGGKEQSEDIKDNYYQLEYVTGVSLGSPTAGSVPAASDYRFYFNGTDVSTRKEFEAECHSLNTTIALVNITQGEIELGTVIFAAEGLKLACSDHANGEYGSTYVRLFKS